MKVTAQQVNDLRQRTGAGMMDCKKALEEAQGDMEQAVDILRKKGQKVAANRSDRNTTEGVALAAVSADSKIGFAMALGCETDFVAKNEGFIQMTKTILDIAMKNQAESAEAVKNLPYDATISIGDKIVEQIGVIGKKIDLVSYEKITGELVTAYNHPGYKLVSLVAVNKNSAQAAEAAKQVSMQVAAMSPIALDKSAVTQETIDRELAVAKELAINEGKPAEMAEKIAQGRLAKFFKESTLLEQEFIDDAKKTVAQYMNGMEAGLTCTAFRRVSLTK
jgi:elongation factor Ts